MKVKELIELLAKCNPEDMVMYDAQPALNNEDWSLIDSAGEVVTEEYPHFGINDVQPGSGSTCGGVPGSPRSKPP